MENHTLTKINCLTSDDWAVLMCSSFTVQCLQKYVFAAESWHKADKVYSASGTLTWKSF